MQGSTLNMKRFHSEHLSTSLGSRIYSPSPVKKASRIGVNVAREIYDVPHRIEEFECDFDDAPISFSGIIKGKSCTFLPYTDSSLEFSSGSELSMTGTSGDCESPSRSTLQRNPLFQEDLIYGITGDLPSRTSNPIVFDSRFEQHDHDQSFLQI